MERWSPLAIFFTLNMSRHENTQAKKKKTIKKSAYRKRTFWNDRMYADDELSVMNKLQGREKGKEREKKTFYLKSSVSEWPSSHRVSGTTEVSSSDLVGGLRRNTWLSPLVGHKEGDGPTFPSK